MKRILIALALLCLPYSAHGQALSKLCVQGATNPNNCIPVSSSTPLPVTPSAPSGTSDVNIKQVNGATVAVGHGTAATAQRVELPTDGTGVVGLNAGSNVIGKVSVDQATPGTTNAVQTIPGTSGGLSNYVVEAAASDNHAVIKNGAGQVYGIQVFNNSATVNYLRLYNAGTGFNGCNSATNIAWEGNIPASTSGAGFIANLQNGIAFATGISICITGAFGQTDTTNATASAISVNVQYK